MDKHKLFPFPCPECGKTRNKRIKHKDTLCRSCAVRKRSIGKFGSQNHRWKGGRTFTAKGYVMVTAKNHPRNQHGYIAEHVLVAEGEIGRYLLPNECVHHINLDKQDNRPENLIVMTISEHTHKHRGFQKIYPCKSCGKPSKNNRPLCLDCLYGSVEWPNKNDVLFKLGRGESLNQQSKELGVSRPRFQNHYRIFPGKPKGHGTA